MLDSWDRNDLLHEFIDLENNLKPYADTLRPSLLIADLSRQETGASQHKKRRITEEIDSSSQDPPITQGLEELESAKVTGDDDVQRHPLFLPTLLPLPNNHLLAFPPPLFHKYFLAFLFLPMFIHHFLVFPLPPPKHHHLQIPLSNNHHLPLVPQKKEQQAPLDVSIPHLFDVY